MSVQNLQVQAGGNVDVTQSYPSIYVVQSVAVLLPGSLDYPMLDNVRVSSTADGNFFQVRDPNTGEWATLMATAGQVVIGPGET